MFLKATRPRFINNQSVRFCGVEALWGAIFRVYYKMVLWKGWEMKIPEDLSKFVKDLHDKQEKREWKREEAKKAREETDKERKGEWLKRGLTDAEFIFKWAKELASSETGRSLIKLGSKTFLGGFMFFDDKLDGLYFRGLGVSEDCLWWMRSGCGARPERVGTPRQMAQEVEPAILAAAVADIRSGKVWKTIKNRWELKELDY